ncbi:ABC transporter permease [Alkaliphilus crotonatoxidans]
MNLLENIRLALSSIRANKMRTFLTMLGMIIGISAVVAISVIGNGGKYQIQKSLEQFGTNRLMIYMNWSNEDLRRRDYLTDRDLEALKSIEGIEAMAPLYEEYNEIALKDKKHEVLLYGANADSEIISNVELLMGRFINEEDLNQFRRAIVISEKDARELFGRLDVIGEVVTLKTPRGDLDFQVVGISRLEESQFTGSGMYGSVYVPMTTIMRHYNLDVYYGVNLKVTDRQQMDQIGQQVVTVLERIHNNQDMYTVYNLEEALETVDSVLSTIILVLALIAGIALLVGGIGIMNIMLVTVTERIREIGVKKAIGAKKRVILSQFLTESALISLAGGLLGIAFGFLFGLAASVLLDMPLLISVKEITTSSILAISVGIIFGVYPANRAAKLDPIEALRYE